MAKIDYYAHATPLSEAINIALDALQRFVPPGFTHEHLAHVVSVHREWKEQVLHPTPAYRNKRSLQYLQANVLTYFLEATGPTVDYFWQQVQQQRLPYQRVNRLSNILKRNKINSRIEYDLVVDVLVPYQQEGLFTADEIVLLTQMIGEFENRKRPR